MLVMKVSAANKSNPAEAANQPLVDKVKKVLEAIRPAVQNDGGDIEFVSMDAAGHVSVRFHGACIGCPSASMTLKTGIEKNLKAYVPEVTGVEAVP